MPCIDTTTASHRQFIPLPAYLFVEALKDAVLTTGHGDGGEPLPTYATADTAINLIVEVPFRLLGEPDISPFYGEIHMSWMRGTKQVILMCFPNRAPLIHYYHRTTGAPSVHDIEPASAGRLTHWLEWLRV